MLGSSRRMTVARPARPHGARRDAARRAYGRAAAVSDPASLHAGALTVVACPRAAGRGVTRASRGRSRPADPWRRGGSARAAARRGRPHASQRSHSRASRSQPSSPTVIPGPSYRPTKPSRPGLSFVAFRRINPLCSLMLHALGCIATYHETTHAVSCPSALEGCMHASSETHAVSECTMFRHTCVAQSPTPFPPYSHP